MSESEYSAEQDFSDDDYDVEQKPRQRLRAASRNRNYEPAYRQPKPPGEKRQTRTKRTRYQTDSQNLDQPEQRKNYNYAEEYGEDIQQQQLAEEEDEFSIFNIQISQILWRRIRESTGQLEYLIKFKGRSYMHCQWLTEPQIQALGKPMKNKINRFNKTFNIKIAEGNYDEEAIEQGKYFDQSFLEVDRILTATEMFPVIHQKKANQIKGKWTESLMVVCSKLLNFTKNHMHYGVLFCEPVDPQRDNCPQYFKIIPHPMDLGTILNKIFLDLYKNSNQFWQDIGLVFKNCLKFNKEQTSDLHILGLTLRQCAIFLYDQWYHLSQQRYIKLKQELGDSLNQEQNNSKQNKPQNGSRQNIKQEELNSQNKQQKQSQMKDEAQESINKPTINGQQQENKMTQQNNQIPKEQKMDEQKPNEQEENQTSPKIINKDVSSQKIKQQDYIKEEQKMQQEQKQKKLNQSQQFESEGEQMVKSKNQNLNKQDEEYSSEESSSRKELENQHISDQSRQFLNMQQFYEKNIFLTDKKCENPTTKDQLELLNPGDFSYKWLAQTQQQAAKFIAHNYEEIDFQDMKKLDLNVQVDRLYLVKWKNLSYSEATWQLQSVISCPQKINQFKMINKALGREARTAMDSQREKHKILVDLEFNPKKKSKYTSTFQLNQLKNKLYFYDVGNKKQPPQYKIENQPVYKNYKLLRPYQLDSVNWLIKSWYQRRNTILADEMGLGKTIQSIAFLYHLYSVENVKGPFLIIAPLSTLQHWKRTVQQWTNMNCVLYYDQNGQPGRRSIQYYQWNHTNITMKGNTVPSELNKFQILITSYEVFTLDFLDVMINIPIQFIIVDQAHRLKNKNAKILATLKRLPCKRVLLLTGTPIQNNTGQLWSLLNYIHPEKFSSYQEFKRNFGDLSSQQQVERLNKVLKPYMLRRMKEDVQQSIPPLQQTIIDVQMTNIQKTIYRALYQKNKNMLIKGLSSSSSYNTNLNNLEIQLRKCCNHPFLIKQIQHDLLKEVYTVDEKVQKLINASGKMVLVQRLLQKCKRQGKKMLIFSQFTHMLQLIQEYLKFKEYKYQRIDGQIKAKERQAAIDRYNNPHKKRDVFLLSTKAGGVGINLTSANVVIIYDSDWNPQNDVQATARAHRIGQKSQVQVYRLVTCNTYETQMFERATQKLGIDKAIFMSGTFKQTGEINPLTQNKMSKNQMQTLLKKGILGFLENNKQDEQQKTQKFFNKNVDQIIQSNSRLAKYSMINGSCTFSKQRFVSQNSDNQLKINDPNFWNIVLKNVQSHTQQLLKKIKNPENFKTLQDQKKLMVEASQLMGTIIQNKLSLTGFNADDQINLTQFLTIVNSQRHFHKHYRDLASQWLEQITKPSRRFKKFNVEDLQIPKKNQLPATTKKVNTRSQEDDNIFGEEQQEQQQEESQDKNKITEAKKQEYLKKLCFLCQKPKCSIFCKSYCKRAFHEQCRKKVQQEGITNFDDIASKIDIKQLCMDNEQLKQIADMNYTCNDCKANTVQCLICKGKGNYYGAQYKKNKKGKNKNGEQIVEQVQTTSKGKKKNELTKCSTANCAKFFHPKCIEMYDTKKLFKYIDANSMHFRCSLHYCNACGISGDTMSIYQCVRCPKALHTRCMDKDKVVKVSKKQFICDTHFKNKKDLKKTQDRLQTQTLKRFIKNQKADSKKKQKQKQQQSAPQQVLSQEQQSENQIAHNYSTRRNKGGNNDESPKILSDQEPVSQKQLNISKSDKEDRRGKKKDTGPLVTYEELGIKPISEFDYKNYNEDWCRYCGSRYSSNFTQGPWGSKTLCTVHYIKWKQEKTLKLEGYPERPQTPIDPLNDQQRKYITSIINKHPEWSYPEVIDYLESKKNPKRLQPI